MSMSRKNYVDVADSLETAIIAARAGLFESQEAMVIAIAADLAAAFKRDNGNFSYTTFFKAIGTPVPARFAGAK